MDFAAGVESVSKRKEGDKITTIKFDPFKNEVKQTIVDNTSGELRGIDLGEFKEAYRSGSFEGRVNKTITIPPFEETTIQNFGNSIKKKVELNRLTAKLRLYGNPLLDPDVLITMDGALVKKDLGNWYVRGVSHKIAPNFITTLDLVKNASNHEVDTSTGTAKQEPVQGTVNKTKGVAEKEDKVVINIYDTQGKLVAGKTQSGKRINY